MVLKLLVLHLGKFDIITDIIFFRNQTHDIKLFVYNIVYKNDCFSRSHAYDVYAIKVGHIPNGIVGEPVEFESNC